MLDTSIHDPVYSRLHAEATRCQCMWNLLDQADLFVDAAQVYLAAHAANLSNAATVPTAQLISTMQKAVALYANMETTNMDEFNLRKHGGFAKVETLGSAIRTSSPDAEHAWFSMLEILKGDTLDRSVPPAPGTLPRRTRRETIAPFK